MSLDLVDDLEYAEDRIRELAREHSIPDALADYCRPTCRAEGVAADCADGMGWEADPSSGCGCPCHERDEATT